MNTRQFRNEAATNQDDANELALLQSFDAGEWASTPNEAQDIARYRAAVEQSIARTLARIEGQTWNRT